MVPPEFTKRVDPGSPSVRPWRHAARGMDPARASRDRVPPLPLRQPRAQPELPKSGPPREDGSDAAVPHWWACGARDRRGMARREYRAYGYDYPSGSARGSQQLAEAIEVIRAVWADESDHVPRASTTAWRASSAKCRRTTRSRSWSARTARRLSRSPPDTPTGGTGMRRGIRRSANRTSACVRTARRSADRSTTSRSPPAHSSTCRMIRPRSSPRISTTTTRQRSHPRSKPHGRHP